MERESTGPPLTRTSAWQAFSLEPEVIRVRFDRQASETSAS